MKRRRRFSGDLKAKVALEALRGDRTLQEIASKHQVHPNQVSTWKRQAIEGLGEVFSNGVGRRRRDHDSEVHELHAKIGELTVERDFCPEGPVDEPGRAPGDGDAPSPWAEFEPSMPFAIDRAILALLHAQGRECGEPCANAAHR